MRAVTWCVRGDASKAHIWAVFASPWTARTLCVGSLGLGVVSFFDRAVQIVGLHIHLRWSVRDVLRIGWLKISDIFSYVCGNAFPRGFSHLSIH
jgi:hypothetical protein